ncbi:MAG: hypothetical protein MI865_02660 [Proteobacteria bacterium]|nr:hypothetical protein [Pseudomonadota bacterium]
MAGTHVLTIADVGASELRELLARFGLSLDVLADDTAITGSFWGEPEAGIVGSAVYVRADTPIHSLLHEACHVICMSEERRNNLHKDAGGDDLEEAAVCYLQVLLADEIGQVGRDRLMQDMDAWGYSFRLGNTARWFYDDADDARDWLISNGLLTVEGRPSFELGR